MRKPKLKTFFIALFFVVLSSIILAFYLDIKLILIIIFTFTIILSYVIYKEKIGQELVVALIIAFAWTSYYYYEYAGKNFFIGKINLFPLVSWTFGLIVLREIYERIMVKNKFLIVSLAYIILLIFVEFVGYYLLNIKLNSNYAGLFGLGVIHAPWFMKIFYLVIGPLYLLITDYLEVK